MFLKNTLAAAICFWGSFALCNVPAEDVLKPNSCTLTLNGVSTSAFFNDGDTFKILSGEGIGHSARLDGFNSLESYGPVHQWGDFTAEDLYENAKKATQNARRGGWHCVTKFDADTYGRYLVQCRDLALDHIQKGLAHVMTVTDKAGNAEYVQAQQQAIQNRVGMWAKGVPHYILTSAHSIDENPNQKRTYNRYVSTEDGHSFMDKHNDLYRDCENICAHPSNLQGGPQFVQAASCMTYVSFNDRYGNKRASCLK